MVSPKPIVLFLTIIIAATISAQSTIYRHNYETGYEFKVTLGKFKCLMLNTSFLLGPISPATGKGTENLTEFELAPSHSNRFTYMVMPIGEAYLPVNWNYIVADDQQTISLYGFPIENQDEELELEVIRHDSANSKASRCMIKILAEKPADGGINKHTAEQIDDKEHELEFAFHQVKLEKFLIQHATEVDEIFSKFIWPGSSLVEVRQFGFGGGVLVRIRNKGENASLIERLTREIDRATRGGHHQELCKFKRSKAISVEHLFRSRGLYPNWCTFKFRHEVAHVF